jgi:glycosyltransferase involved in cell wall biosynthesis
MSGARTASKHCFVLPALDGPLTGGTLYNRGLLAALAQIAKVDVLELSAPELGNALATASRSRQIEYRRWLRRAGGFLRPSLVGAAEIRNAHLTRGAGFTWLDSLYLHALPELQRHAPGPVGLIVHYLASFVELGRAATPGELSAEERSALQSADALLVTSAFMRDAIEALVAPKKPILVVEPSVNAERSLAMPEVSAELSVVVVGNVVPGKGIEAWLRALETALAVRDRLRVSIVGSLRLAPDYAERCQRLVRESASLGERVVFLDSLSQPETLAVLARSELFVSASRMESYGIALAEARAVGVPILALAGGNAAAHVTAEGGGALVEDDEALARACLGLARDRASSRERLGKARARARLVPARSWSDAAREFSAQLAEWAK